MLLLVACVENIIVDKNDPAEEDTAVGDSDLPPVDSGADTAGKDDSGSGTLPIDEPDIAVAPTALDLGTVELGASAAEAFVVSNLGQAALEVTAMPWSGGDSTPFTLSLPDGVAFPVVLDPGASFAVVVSFAPTAAGDAAADLVVESDDPDEPSVPVALVGNAEAGHTIGDFFIVITDDDRHLSLFAADGSGGFASRQELGTDPGEALDSPVVGDIDNDGTWDALARGASGTLYSQRWNGSDWDQDNAGSISFTPQAAGDFDSDGNLDLAGLDTSEVGRVSLGAGDGSFASAASSFDPGASWSGYSWRLAPRAGDLDGDGNVDLVAADYSSAADDNSGVWLLLGNGDGTFASAVQVSTVTTPVNGLDLGDLDGDGNLDLVAGLDDDGDAGQLFVLLGDGAGDLGAASTSTDLNPATESGTNGDGAGRLTLFDWSGDAVPDVLCTYQTDPYSWDQEVRLVPGDGSGDLGAASAVGEAGVIDNIDLAVPVGH